MKDLKPVLSGAAVTEAIRSAYGRKDMDAMRKIVSNNISDDILNKIGSGELEIRGDSSSEFVVYTTDKRYIVPTHYDDGQIPENEWIDITGKSEGHVERVMYGMMRNLSDQYYLDIIDVQGFPI